MDSKRLRYFLAVAEEEHFLRAGQRLHVSQSALSRQIKALELELGCLLFDRHSGGTLLTDAGHVLKKATAQLLHAYDQAVLQTQKASLGTAGALDIGVNEIAAKNTRISSALRIFRDNYPDIQINLRFLSSQQQIESLREAKLDMGFVFFNPYDSRNFSYLGIDKDTYDLLIPPGHPLASKQEITIDDLDNEKFITINRLFNRTYWDITFGYMIAKGINPIIVQEADNLSATVSLVSAGLGLSFVHRSYGARDIPTVVARTVSGLDITLDLDAVWRKDNRSEMLKNFVEVLKKTLS